MSLSGRLNAQAGGNNQERLFSSLPKPLRTGRFTARWKGEVLAAIDGYVARTYGPEQRDDPESREAAYNLVVGHYIGQYPDMEPLTPEDLSEWTETRRRRGGADPGVAWRKQNEKAFLAALPERRPQDIHSDVWRDLVLDAVDKYVGPDKTDEERQDAFRLAVRHYAEKYPDMLSIGVFRMKSWHDMRQEKRQTDDAEVTGQSDDPAQKL